MELFEEAIDLVTLLMDESTKFYKIFNRTQLNDITIKIAESCDSILTTSLDPLGWEGGDPIDMVEDYDNEEIDDLDRNFQSPTHLNIDATLEVIYILLYLFKFSNKVQIMEATIWTETINQ